MRVWLLFILLSLLGTWVRAEEPALRGAELRTRKRFEKELQQEPASAALHTAYASFLADHGQVRSAISHLRLEQMLEPQNAAIAKFVRRPLSAGGSSGALRGAIPARGR